MLQGVTFLRRKSVVSSQWGSSPVMWSRLTLSLGIVLSLSAYTTNSPQGLAVVLVCCQLFTVSLQSAAYCLFATSWFVGQVTKNQNGATVLQSSGSV